MIQVQSTCIRSFILSAFDMARELQITPKRLQYVQEKESELHQGLIRVASDKQEEITTLIENTLQELRDSLLDRASECETVIENPSSCEGMQAAQAATKVSYNKTIKNAPLYYFNCGFRKCNKWF
jgi:hypothetical protein